MRGCRLEFKLHRDRSHWPRKGPGFEAGVGARRAARREP